MVLKVLRYGLFAIGIFIIIENVNPGYKNPDTNVDSLHDKPPFTVVDSIWADSVMNVMDLDQKIGQMIMVQAYSNRGADHLTSLGKTIKKYQPGGVVFFQGDPASQVKMTNYLQNLSGVPLLIAMDAEWGLGMRLNNVISYPRQMMLGAIQNNDLIYEMGWDIAEQLKMLGVHMNFAPVADVNNNPRNPVINTRSFGEGRENVTSKVNAYFQGMQDNKLLVTAKHYPGHGDTEIDSHYGLPVIMHGMQRLDSVELFPFRHAIQNGLTGVMIAHLHVPAIDSNNQVPTTLSWKAVDSLLVKEMGFEGLVVTDALNMKGVTADYKAGEIELEAVKAGADILLMPESVERTISAIKKAIRHGELTEERIDRSCRKILIAKKWSGADTLTNLSVDGLVDDLNSRKYLPLRHMVSAQAITLVKNDQDLVPFADIQNLNYAVLHFGIEGPTQYSKILDKYKKGDHFFFDGHFDLPTDSIMNDTLIPYNALIVSLYYTRSFGNNFDIPPGVIELLDKIDFDGPVLLNHFGYPYALDVMGDLNAYDAIMLAYTNDSINQRNAAQAVFGGIAISGRLPVSTREFPAGSGFSTGPSTRLKYTFPENVGMNYDTLKRIDEIVNHAIRRKAMPGCQVLVAKNGEVVWQKAYGYHTYNKRQKLSNEDIYDLASITKIASTIPSLMRLIDQGKFQIDSTLGHYMPVLDTSAKSDLLIRDILTHQAGFKPWIPFYTSTLETLDTSQVLFSNKFSFTYPYKIGPAAYANRNIVHKDSIYQKEYTPEFPLQVAEDLYLRSDYRDSVYMHILTSPLGEKTYKYSDLGYYYFYKIIEEISDTLFYPYNWYSFYGPLGAETLGFLPLNRFSPSRIVPTENDIIFRNQLIRGHVHDPGAAMLGGICGHAGLFSNSNDLAKLMQMFLNKGVYGGRRFIDSATIAEFTRCQFCEQENRRALGFDRPITDEEDAGPACNSASELSYGHSGFTGTLTWMDPKYDLLYIFLSNRIHPDQYNTKLISMNVRTEIQQVIYNSFLPMSDSLSIEQED